jgi:ankyrin repeat protein
MDETHPLLNAITNDDFTTFVQLLGNSAHEIGENVMRIINVEMAVEYPDDVHPFIQCAQLGRYEMLKYLINIPELNINHKDEYGHNALSTIIYNTGNSENVVRCAKLFISHRLFNINAVDNTNRTVLMLAASEAKHYQIVKLLLKRDDIDVNIVDNDNLTALLCATMWCLALNTRLILRHPRVHLCFNDESENTLLIQYVGCESEEMDLLFCRQLINHRGITTNERRMAEYVSVMWDKIFVHAMLIHGRI